MGNIQNIILRYLRIPLIGLGAAAVLGIASLLGYTGVVVWKPAHEAQIQARADVLMAQRAVDDLEARIALAADYTRLQTELDELKVRYSKQVDRAQTVANLADISEVSGSRIIHGANNFGEERGGVIPVEQELTLEGSYQSIRRFFEELALIDTFTIVRSLEITADRNGRQVRTKIRLITLSEKPSL